MNTVKKLLGLCLLLAIAAIPARAQVGFELGPRVGVNVGDDVGDFFLGADARASVVTLPVDLNASFDFYLGQENTNFWHLHLGALYPFELPGSPAAPYVGAGLGITRWSTDFDDIFGEDVNVSDSQVGLDLIGGAAFEVGNLKPFAQLGLTLGDIDLVTIGGGLLFSLGGVD